MEHWIHLRARSLPSQVCPCTLLQSLSEQRVAAILHAISSSKLCRAIRVRLFYTKKLAGEQTFAAI